MITPYHQVLSKSNNTFSTKLLDNIKEQLLAK